MDSEDLKERDSTWQPVPGLHHPCGTEVLPSIQTEPPALLFVPTAPCPGTDTEKSLAPSSGPSLDSVCLQPRTDTVNSALY